MEGRGSSEGGSEEGVSGEEVKGRRRDVARKRKRKEVEVEEESEEPVMENTEQSTPQFNTCIEQVFSCLSYLWYYCT